MYDGVNISFKDCIEACHHEYIFAANISVGMLEEYKGTKLSLSQTQNPRYCYPMGVFLLTFHGVKWIRRFIRFQYTEKFCQKRQSILARFSLNNEKGR